MLDHAIFAMQKWTLATLLCNALLQFLDLALRGHNGLTNSQLPTAEPWIHPFENPLILGLWTSNSIENPLILGIWTFSNSGVQIQMS